MTNQKTAPKTISRSSEARILDGQVLLQVLPGRRSEITMVSKKKRVELAREALRKAVYDGRAQDVERLLADADVAVDAKRRDGRTPLFNAVWEGHGEVVSLLLNKGADVNATMRSGETPLYLAIFRGRTAMVKQLLDQGAFVNQVVKGGYNKGTTSLHHAAMFPMDARITQMLLDRGADIFARNKAGKSPEDIAGEKVAALLRAEATRRARCVAFASGHHERLGAGSLVLSLHPEVVRMILEQV